MGAGHIPSGLKRVLVSEPDRLIDAEKRFDSVEMLDAGDRVRSVRLFAEILK